MNEKMENHIDFVHAFQIAAEELIISIKESKLLNSAGNIRDSGLSLENKFRSILGRMLPGILSIKNGYIVSPNRRCSPQTDVVVTHNYANTDVLSTASDQRFFTNTGIFAIGEIKTRGNPEKSINQLSKIVDFYLESGTEYSSQEIPEGRSRFIGDIFTFIIDVGGSHSRKSIKLAYSQNQIRNPTAYLIFPTDNKISKEPILILPSDEDGTEKIIHTKSERRSIFTPDCNEEIKNGSALMAFLIFMLRYILILNDGVNMIPHGHAHDSFYKILEINNKLRFLGSATEE